MENKKGFTDKYFLEKIYLSGYKSIQQTEIELKSNFNIIIGKNGAGKTNFMEFLHKLLNDDFQSVFDFEARLNFSGQKRIEIKAERKFSQAVLEKKQINRNEDLNFSIDIDGEKTDYKISDYMSPSQNFNQELIKSSTLIKHGIPAEYRYVDKPVTLTTDLNEWPGNQFADITYSQPYFINGLYYSYLFEDIIFNQNIRSKRTDKNGLEIHLAKTIFKVIDDIKIFLKQITPIKDVRFSSNYNIFENVGKFTITNLFLEFEVNGAWQPFAYLSDGTKRLFYIISEVGFSDYYYFRDSNFGETVSNSRIILIEEPELGIHPHQFHNLMTFLKEQSQTKQIIITTHSPEALNILSVDELDSIILSSYDKEKGTQLRHMTDNEKTHAKSYIKDMYLSDYWMHSNLEPAN